MSMRTDLEILSSFDLIITTSTSDSECASMGDIATSFGLRPSRMHPLWEC